jgi:hypothetical protein
MANVWKEEDGDVDVTKLRRLFFFAKQRGLDYKDLFKSLAKKVPFSFLSSPLKNFSHGTKTPHAFTQKTERTTQYYSTVVKKSI